MLSIIYWMFLPGCLLHVFACWSILLRVHQKEDSDASVIRLDFFQMQETKLLPFLRCCLDLVAACKIVSAQSSAALDSHSACSHCLVFISHFINIQSFFS